MESPKLPSLLIVLKFCINIWFDTRINRVPHHSPKRHKRVPKTCSPPWRQSSRDQLRNFRCKKKPTMILLLLFSDGHKLNQCFCNCPKLPGTSYIPHTNSLIFFSPPLHHHLRLQLLLLLHTQGNVVVLTEVAPFAARQKNLYNTIGAPSLGETTR